MARNIVVIGGGPAAVFAAIEAKKKDGAANVTLVTDETCEPYEKPPLSKAVLLGKAKPEDAPIAGPGGLAAHGVAVKLNILTRKSLGGLEQFRSSLEILDGFLVSPIQRCGSVQKALVSVADRVVGLGKRSGSKEQAIDPVCVRKADHVIGFLVGRDRIHNQLLSRQRPTGVVKKILCVP